MGDTIPVRLLSMQTLYTSFSAEARILAQDLLQGIDLGQGGYQILIEAALHAAAHRAYMIACDEVQAHGVRQRASEKT